MHSSLAETAAALAVRLNQSLPGETVQYLMAPEGRRSMPRLPDASAIPGAVMIALCEDDTGIFIPLIVRHVYEGPHSGQVSLPGGKRDAGDEDAIATAVRECSEEIGLTGLEVIGMLSPLYIPVSGFNIDVVVGWCRRRSPELVIHEREVERILHLPLAHLLDNTNIRTGHIETGGGMRVTAPWYEYQGYRVWGATAMVLSEFTCVLREACGIR